MMTEEKIRKIVQDEVKKQIEPVKEKIALETNPFKRVRKLLNRYNSFKKRVEDLEKHLESVELTKRCGYDIIFSIKYEHLSDFEKIELKKSQIKTEINEFRGFIELVDFALNEIKNDKYFGIVKLLFFERFSNEKVAEILNIDVSTVKRNKKRLFTEIVEAIYPDEFLKNF